MIEVLVVGGPHDGERLRCRQLVECLHLESPIIQTVQFPTLDELIHPRPSIYYLLTIRLNNEPLHIYAHESIDMFDAWHRLIHRYPTNPREPSRTYPGH